MIESRFRTAAALGRSVSQAEMAGMVTAQAGRTVHQTQWGRYESGDSEPPLDVIRATAKVSGLDPAYLAFGADSVLDELDPSKDRRITDEDLDRAERKIAAKSSATTPQGKAAKRAGKRGRP